MPTKRLVVPLASVLLGWSALPAASADWAQLMGSISASTIAVISDGDFVGQTYATGRLAPVEAGYRDLLTVMSIINGQPVMASLPVSNSVTAAPEVLDLTADGRTVFVTERLGERLEGAQTVQDLSPGNRLFAIDLSDKANPRLSDTTNLASFPEALAVSPDGRHIAVVSNTPEASFVQFVTYDEGRFGEVLRIDLTDLGLRGTSSGPRNGVTATNVQWHPSGRFIAVNINTQNRIAFFEITDAKGRSALRPWGNIVDVGADPFVGRFTPDGRFYLTSDWERDFAATDLAGRVPNRPSSISVIQLANPTASDEHHQRIFSVETDVAAEGIAISPDGRFVATVNMRGTAFPPESDRFQREGTVTLLTFDRDTGNLTKIADYPFEGVLPEGGTFDLTGDHFLATVFHGHAGASKGQGAGLEVFRVVRGDNPGLKSLGRISLPHGTHHVDVAGP